MTVHEIEFSDDTPKLNGKHLDRLLEAYITSTQRNNQPVTIKGYRCKLRPFFTWWNEYGPEREWVLASDDLSDFVRYLDERTNLSFRGRYDTVKRLRQMFRWAHKRGAIPVDFSMFVPDTKGGAPERRAVSLPSLQALLNACWKMSDPIRNRGIIAVMAGTGLRLEECASLSVEKVEFLPAGSGFITPSVTKNDKPRTVVFDASTGAFIRQWLDVLGKTEGPLWPSRTGGKTLPLSKDGMHKVVYDAANLAGIDCSPHDLRRMFATIFMRVHRGEGYAKLLQKQMGHTHFSTTALYMLPTIDDIHEVMNDTEASPVAKLDTSNKNFGLGQI